MAKLFVAPDKPISNAHLAWEAAVDAVLRDVDRIAKGGQSQPARTGELMAAVDFARLQWERANAESRLGANPAWTLQGASYFRRA